MLSARNIERFFYIHVNLNNFNLYTNLDEKNKIIFPNTATNKSAATADTCSTLVFRHNEILINSPLLFKINSKKELKFGGHA